MRSVEVRDAWCTSAAKMLSPACVRRGHGQTQRNSYLPQSRRLFAGRRGGGVSAAAIHLPGTSTPWGMVNSSTAADVARFWNLQSRGQHRTMPAHPQGFERSSLREEAPTRRYHRRSQQHASEGAVTQHGWVRVVQCASGPCSVREGCTVLTRWRPWCCAPLCPRACSVAPPPRR